MLKILESLPYISALAPFIVICLGGLTCLMIEVLPCKAKVLAAAVGILTTLVSIAILIANAHFYVAHQVLFDVLFFDPVAWIFSLLLLIALLGSLMIAVSSATGSGVESYSEFISLYLFVGFGGLVFLNSASFLAMFVGLETFSLALYALVASAVGERRSAEAGLKYFLLGSFSSCIMLYGIALLFGVTGSLQLTVVLASPALDGMGGTLALGLVLSGLLFKVGAFPLHFWVPDTYQGAPVSVTVLMASLVKVAAFGALCRVIWLLGGESDLWEGFIWIFACLSMVAGNIGALRQTSIVRMLAYSSIAQAGYITVGILSSDLYPVVIFYLIGYVIVTLALFSGIAMISKKGSEVTYDSLRGFGSQRPMAGIGMSWALLSIAGLPPGLAGLFAKLFLLQEATRTGYLGLCIMAFFCSVIGCYYYLKMLVAIWSKGEAQGEIGESIFVNGMFGPRLVLGLSTFALVFVGVFPEMVYPWVVSFSK